MSPLEIELILHIYGRRDEIPGRHNHSQRMALDSFVNNGLITAAQCCEAGSHEFTLTARGQAYVHALTSLPWPVRKEMWITDMPEDGFAFITGAVNEEGHRNGE